MSQNLQGSIRLYGCGGLGVNIVSYFEPCAGQALEGHAVAHPCYVDTSRSNIDPGLSDDRIFIMDAMDGSGKVRRENHEEISKNIRTIIQTHQPQDFNVVVFSASGGSGSVIGPLIMSELLTRGLPVVGIVVGSDESTITANNTIGTLKSLEAIAQKTGQPVVISYEQNQHGVKRSDVDAACHHVIGALSLLSSRRNREMDTKDIANWVQFHRTTSVKPRMALLDVYRNNKDVENIVAPISIASLYADPDAPTIQVTPEYHCAGYPRDNVAGFEVMHYVITIDAVANIGRTIQQRIVELDQQRNSRVRVDPLVNDHDVVGDDGMVF